MRTVKLRPCSHCDKFSMGQTERLLSYATEIETVAKCSSCGNNNSKLVFIITLPNS